MEFTDRQIAWLQKAKTQDLSRAYAKKGWDYKTYKQIEKKWMEVNEQQRKTREVRQDALNPDWWDRV
jgi:hypothetical protein